MLIWSKGRSLVVEEFTKKFPSFEDGWPKLEKQLIARIPGTAVFLASSVDFMPPSLMRLAERTKTLSEVVILLTVHHSDAPTVPEARRVDYTALGHDFHRIVIHSGYMELPNVHETIKQVAAEHGIKFEEREVTYYLGRETILATNEGRMGKLAETLYAYLQRNAVAADRQFGIPPAQVVEIGTQIDL
jgi:KUP system potassium uptake protein